MRILSLLTLLCCLCAPALAADPPAAATPYITTEIRWLWGQSQFEATPAVSTTIGKPATITIGPEGGIKVETTVLIRDISNGMAIVTFKIKLTPTGQAATTSEINAVAKLGQAFHTELRPDETRSLSVDFTIAKAPPKEE